MTGVPVQHGLDEAVMDMLTGSGTVTYIVTGLDKTAGLPLTHGKLEVSRQVITSPFTGVQVYCELFVPTFKPFFFHK